MVSHARRAAVRVPAGGGTPTVDVIDDDTHTVVLNRVSWAGALAGAAIALVAQLILNMIGVGVGAATVDPTGGGGPAAETFSMSAAIWWTVSGIIAAFLGGYAAGRLSGQPDRTTASWNGLVSWAASTLVIVYLLATAIGGLLGGTMSALGSFGRTAFEAAGPMLGSDPFSAIEQQMREQMGPGGAQAARDAAIAAVRAALTGDEAEAQQARERAAQAMANAQGVSVEEARQQLGELESRYRQIAQQAQQQAGQAAETASAAASMGGIFGAVALLLGAIAAWFGGRAGCVHRFAPDEEAALR